MPLEYRRVPQRSVALLAEGVIEIRMRRDFIGEGEVALLAEGVDRNGSMGKDGIYVDVSPSSRRAWIEIPGAICHSCAGQSSPSSRRAWIEIGL